MFPLTVASLFVVLVYTVGLTVTAPLFRNAVVNEAKVEAKSQPLVHSSARNHSVGLLTLVLLCVGALLCSLD